MPMPIAQHHHYDAVIVGARCAGAATAMLLARQGLRVLVVERAPYGSDTLSTLALMRTGVLQLARFGLLERLRATGVPAVRRTLFHYDAESVEVAIEPRDGVDALYSPRRSVLDRLLVDAAREAGAEVRHGVRLLGLEHARDGRVTGVRLLAQDGTQARVGAALVIGADGRSSLVARLTSAPIQRRARNATATLYGYFDGLAQPAADANHWYHRADAAAGTVPTHDGLTLVFFAAPARALAGALRGDPSTALRAGLERVAPELVPALARARQVGRLWGFGGAPGYVRACFGPGYALVGDAGYFKDSLTAHGMSDALRDAELLARAVVVGGDAALAEYQTARDALSSTFFELTDRVAACDWSAPPIAQLHRALARETKRECQALLALGAGALAARAPC